MVTVMVLGGEVEALLLLSGMGAALLVVVRRSWDFKVDLWVVGPAAVASATD